MDLDEFRCFIADSGVDVWTWIDMSISVASADHEDELKNRRDAIVQKLYTPKCHNCDDHHRKQMIQKDYHQKQDVNTEEMRLVEEEEDEDEDDKYNNDDEQRKILQIKIRLDDHNQSERSLLDLLQRLLDMDTTFKALKETDIGRHVSKLRKHSSNEVRRLVKVLVRKWKETVDEWVRLNTPMEEEATQFNGFPPGDKNSSNEPHHESIHIDVNTHTDSQKRKVKNNQTESNDSERHQLGQNYQETQHAKKLRTSQVTNFHNIPKLKNPTVSSNGGTGEYIPVNSRFNIS